ncbi:ABC transporter substrate-binding protein [Halomicroarcula sp. S1AR25-4]|uniref:ABC transporter substrate-binding protein n=1 Tax=Haloarcula sp. S1AR25-4 TaxID=2950538 RepID=UPI0028753933|nr:ABC transporter substrate-binding protein [Halomicroarcula sp. S1AR25-4]MDS0279753.1 ABC transporter substrate-binding protein [Halomicroarcula sp. S1AR25-4]
MADDSNATEAPTRREYVKYGGAVIGGGLIAGCSSQSESGATPETTNTATATATETETATDTATEAAVDDGYSVSMAPMGTVEFESVPESVYTGLPYGADMAIASGAADAINSIYYPTYHGTLMNHFYDRLDGVSFEYEGLNDSWNLGKEGFYELDSDVHLSDPAYASTLENLDRDDVTEIRNQIGPWFNNYYSDRRRDPPEAWAEDYEYFSLWEIYERVAQVFRAGDRASALREVHSSIRSEIESGLPPESERPSVAFTFKGEDDTFWVYHLNADGFLNAHTRPLGAIDAFDDTEFDGPQTQVDYEAMLDADPDVILVLFTMASSHSIADIRTGLEDDAVASEISAVQNGEVYAQGARYQGPIMNLFQLEMTAKQLYPDQFGEWPGYVDGEPYPEIPEDDQLFDRQRVANIVNGDI